MIDYKKIRVKAGEVSRLLAQILNMRYPKCLNAPALERELCQILDDAIGKLSVIIGKLTPPPKAEGENDGQKRLVDSGGIPPGKS